MQQSLFLGGHGALIGLPESGRGCRFTVGNQNDRFVISLCHGPAAFLALRHSDNPLNGYSICAFPDAADKQTPDIGYMPGHLTVLRRRVEENGHEHH